MNELFIRTEMMLGSAAMDKLSKSKTAVFGIGGVGSYAAEALARSGIGAIDLIDNDIVSPSNINRQLIALCSTIGKPKADIMKDRISDINPAAVVNAYKVFYTDGCSELPPLDSYDYIIDAIDSVPSKIQLIVNAVNLNIPIISSMGMGNKLNPSLIEIADIYKTEVCPLAGKIRRELRKRNIPSLKTVFTKEPPCPRSNNLSGNERVPASISFVPGAAGLLMAGEVIRNLIHR